MIADDRNSQADLQAVDHAHESDRQSKCMWSASLRKVEWRSVCSSAPPKSLVSISLVLSKVGSSSTKASNSAFDLDGVISFVSELSYEQRVPRHDNARRGDNH